MGRRFDEQVSRSVTNQRLVAQTVDLLRIPRGFPLAKTPTAPEINSLHNLFDPKICCDNGACST
jgi:hypothetical protein